MSIRKRKIKNKKKKSFFPNKIKTEKSQFISYYFT